MPGRLSLSQWFNMPAMLNPGLALRNSMFFCLVALAIGCVFQKPLLAEEKSSPASASLESLAHDFWQWRARYQPFSTDDIPRIDRPTDDPPVPRNWPAGSIARQKAAMA